MKTTIRTKIFIAIGFAFLGLLIMSATSISNGYTMISLGNKASEVSLAVMGDVEVVGKCLADQTLLTTVSASRMDMQAIEKDKKAYLALQKTLSDTLAKLQTAVVDPEMQELLAQITKQLPSFNKSSISVFDQAKSFMQEKAVRVVDEEILPAFSAIDQNVRKIKDRARLLAEEDPKNIVVNAKNSIFYTMILGVVTLVLAGLCGVWVVRSISGSLNNVIQRIAQSVYSMGEVTEGLAETSADLADSANQQAAAIEETSASLEELAGMTHQNAQHSGHATEISSTTKNAAASGSSEMSGMLQAMEEITTSSRAISKIIDTIDNIAFQTNILALNAAVEAARAGESGAGFAVVADEVRNLARRSATAAHETSEKIEEAVKKSQQGAEISKIVSENLSNIARRTTDLDALISEIASASKEQDQGIHLITKAVSQMNQITLNNASKAEKTSESTNQLHLQMNELENVMQELTSLVGG